MIERISEDDWYLVQSNQLGGWHVGKGTLLIRYFERKAADYEEGSRV